MLVGGQKLFRQLKDLRVWRFFILVVFFLMAVGGILFSLSKGAMEISLGQIWQSFTEESQEPWAHVMRNIRLPRTLVGALVGINLSLAGTILQCVMRNPLADPGIIGISSGAGLAGIIILIVFPHNTHLLVPVAFLGAMGAACLIYILAWKGGDIQPMRVILAGVAVSAFLGSFISALMIFYSDRVHGALMWMAGGLSARSWPHFKVILPYTLLGVLIAFYGAQKLNILRLGDEIARGLGLKVEAVRIGLTAVAALLAASAVSVVGLLGFVGLIVPHAARLLIGGDHKFLLPAAALLGTGVVTISDTVARLAFAPVELPVGIIMAFLGAPFFLYLLRRES
ncbi:MAG: FecCD family ABC transporter permease [Bacillota bacterium]|uniref:Iron chelate uptake ABC transporter family permease subunit n=1 Tax=Thermanaerosceptrum fracticalcis TaxID=1712410 RepID=A0A7G6E3N0_THEFR|nr:iron ABC transporter permease [Thermanaerosceptrum fracticalcis]QNB46684.1 iron chelate uptake ABC transporter family permease subunit [Thermanaerosceptrum fracticalcis]